MKILYLGDIMAEPGIQIVEQLLPELKKTHAIDVVIAQAENVSEGKGMLPVDMQRLQATGVDFFTGGNHTTKRPELGPLLNDPAMPVIGPVNMLDCPGSGWKYLATPKGRVLVISILGQIVGKHIPETSNPLHKIDEILEQTKEQPKVATVVNFHGDYSSEKIIFGHYLDGRVSMVVGDHWHIPTADAMMLPKGTAYQTDVGMCGTIHSSLGVTFESVLKRWRDDQQTPNVIELEGPCQLNGLMVDVNEQTGLARSVQMIRQIVD